MRAIWKGQISFGLINIPIELYPAEKRSELQFKLLDNRNKAKVHYERINEKTGKEVPWNEVVKAYEIPKKGYVVLTEEDFKRAAIENTQTVEIEDFIKQDQLDYKLFEKPYYLVPAKHAQKGYVLLREILKKTDTVAISRVIIRTKQYLSVILAQDEALILNLVRYPNEIRSSADLNIPEGSLSQYKITKKEFEMAEKLVESMTVKWNPKKYKDEYKDALLNWIEKKAKLGKIPLPKKPKEQAEETGAEIVDFMELLKKSLKTKEPKKSLKTVARKRKTAERK